MDSRSVPHRSTSDDRPESDPATGDEIADELFFHFRSLVEDGLTRGVPFDKAWTEAETRFGSLRRYSAECRRIAWRNPLSTKALVLAGLVGLGLVAGWLHTEVSALRAEQEVFRQLASRAAAVADLRPNSVVLSSEERSELVGRLVDRRGQPVAGARVLVIVKTWPDGYYRQEDFSTASDERGGFRLPAIVPSEGRFALQVAAVKDGYALTSSYQFKNGAEGEVVEPLVLTLGEATPLTLTIHDRAGHAIPNARLAPASRKSADGREHLVYLQGSDPIQVSADGAGKAHIGCFARGDQAQLHVQSPGQSWRLCTLTIPDEGEAIVVLAENPIEGG